MSNTIEPASDSPEALLNNCMLFGFFPEIVDAFIARGVSPAVWIRTGRKSGQEMRDGMLVLDHTPIKLGDVDAVFSATLDPDLATRVRNLSMPYFIRNINRSARCARDRNKSWAEYNCQLETMIHWYHHLIVSRNIKSIVFNNTPHGGSTIALLFLAKEMGLTVVHCYQTLFANRFFIVDHFYDIGYYRSSFPGEVAPDVKINEKPEKPYYMYFEESVGSLTRQIFMEALKLGYNKIAQKFGAADKSFPFRRKICTYKDRIKMLQIQSKLPAKINLKKKFIYVPLHFQPEVTVDVYGDIYADQLLAIEQLRLFLPDDVHIYVKENPKQTLFARESSFFKRLKAIPETSYISAAVDSFDLIEASIAVATLVGTAGFEALQMGKPVICFGHAWYRCLPGIFNWDAGVKWEDIINFKFDRQKLKNGVAEMSRHFRPGVCQPKGYDEIVEGFDPIKNADLVVTQILDHVSRYENENRLNP